MMGDRAHSDRMLSTRVGRCCPMSLIFFMFLNVFADPFYCAFFLPLPQRRGPGSHRQTDAVKRVVHEPSMTLHMPHCSDMHLQRQNREDESQYKRRCRIGEVNLCNPTDAETSLRLYRKNTSPVSLASPRRRGDMTT